MMLETAYFFRDVKNINELKCFTEKALKEQNKAQPYKIFGKVHLNELEYIYFTENLYKNYDFVKEITWLLSFGNEFEYICILVYSDNFKHGILINSNGYPYPRMCALIDI